MVPVEPVEAEHVPPMLTEKLFRMVTPLQFPAFPFDTFVAGIVDIAERYDFRRIGTERGDEQQEHKEHNAGENERFHSFLLSRVCNARD